jgi:hypothetical protein
VTSALVGVPERELVKAEEGLHDHLALGVHLVPVARPQRPRVRQHRRNDEEDHCRDGQHRDHAARDPNALGDRPRGAARDLLGKPVESCFHRVGHG